MLQIKKETANLPQYKVSNENIAILCVCEKTPFSNTYIRILEKKSTLFYRT